MLAKRLAVIRGDDDHARGGILTEGVQDTTDLRIALRDLVVVPIGDRAS